MVYFLQFGNDGPIKIGVTDGFSPEMRLAGLQVGCPYELRIVATIRSDSTSLERDIHKLFAHLLIRGEWFSPDEELRVFIDRVAIPWTKPTAATNRVDPPVPLRLPTLDQLQSFKAMYLKMELEWFAEFAEGKTLQEIAIQSGLSPKIILASIKSTAVKIRAREAQVVKIQAITDSYFEQMDRLEVIAGRLSALN